MPPHIPSWDLSLVQGPVWALVDSQAPVSLNENSAPAALASIKRVGDLHAFSVDDSCLQFGPAEFPDNPEAPARLCAQGSHY